MSYLIFCYVPLTFSFYLFIFLKCKEDYSIEAVSPHN
jgi:hypothetical protein